MGLTSASFQKDPLSRMSLKSSLVAAAALLFPAVLFAQDAPFNCSTHGLQHLSRFLDGHPERVQQIEAAEHQLETFTGDFARDFDARGGGNQYVIPVVFHIIHNGGPENISDEQGECPVRCARR